MSIVEYCVLWSHVRLFQRGQSSATDLGSGRHAVLIVDIGCPVSVWSLSATGAFNHFGYKLRAVAQLY